MPNPGGPYGGCDACRRRKCDQTFPACRRCIKRGTPCPGVRDRRTQVFRDETSKTVAKAGYQELNEESQPIASQHKAEATELSWNDDAANPRSLTRSHATATPIVPQYRYHVQNESLPVRLNPPQEDVLVAFFFDQFTCPNVGWYEHLLPLYRNAAGDSYLNTSIQAASLFVLANQQRDDSLSLIGKARSTYGDALTSLNAAIGDEKERVKDEVLCTVLILNIIEDITGSRDLFCHAHLSGLQRILRLRKSLGIKSLFGAEVWHAVALKLQLLTLQTSKETSPYSSNRYSNELLIPQMLVSPTLITHETCDAVRKLRNSVGSILSNARSHANGYDVDSLCGLFCQGRKLDGLLKAWCHEEQGAQLLSRWQRHIAPVHLDENACTNMEYFTSVQAAEVWNQNRCARICLHQTLLDLADHLLSPKYSSSMDVHTRYTLEATVAESRHIIDGMLNGICSSIPFNLHKVDSKGRACADQSQRVVGGVGLVWPLEIVLSCPYSSKAHKSLAADALREIGHTIGVRQALLVVRD